VDFAVVFVAGYLVGSLPTAFLLVRRKKGIDIRKAGSGNVGAFNAFEVTSSKMSGVTVGIIDALKGFVVSACFAWVLKVSFELQATAFLGTVIGHNYPVWLKFEGGRGLATTAGGLFAIGLAYGLIWCSVWLIVYRWKKDIHIGNVVAIAAAPLILLVIPEKWTDLLMVVDASARSYQILAFILSGVLFVSHWDVVKKLRFSRRVEHE
jgi:glycerol-3-phosphate acyltransferase PlsY